MYPKGQEDQLVPVGLDVNALMLWNSVYMGRVMRQLGALAPSSTDEDVERLAALASESQVRALPTQARLGPAKTSARGCARSAAAPARYARLDRGESAAADRSGQGTCRRGAVSAVARSESAFRSTCTSPSSSSSSAATRCWQQHVVKRMRSWPKHVAKHSSAQRTARATEPRPRALGRSRSRPGGSPNGRASDRPGRRRAAAWLAKVDRVFAQQLPSHERVDEP